MLKRHWLIILGAVVVISVVAAFKFKGQDKPQYFTTKADHGDIREVVEATGTINSVIMVQVGSQVSGTISHLFRLHSRDQGTKARADSMLDRDLI